MNFLWSKMPLVTLGWVFFIVEYIEYPGYETYSNYFPLINLKTAQENDLKFISTCQNHTGPEAIENLSKTIKEIFCEFEIIAQLANLWIQLGGDWLFWKSSTGHR